LSLQKRFGWPPSLDREERRESDTEHVTRYKVKRERKREKQDQKHGLGWRHIGKKKDVIRGGLSLQKRFGWPPSLDRKERRESDTEHGTTNKVKRERKREKQDQNHGLGWRHIGKKKDVIRGGLSLQKRFGWPPSLDRNEPFDTE